MHAHGPRSWNRRDFIARVALAGAGYAGWVGSAAAEAPPETARVRIVKVPAICVAPQFVAEELLKGEGFSDVQYVPIREGIGTFQLLAAGEADISIAFVAPFIIQADAGAPIVMLGGIHTGCFELFGGERVRSVRDLKGKKVAVPDLGSSHHVFIATIATHIGLDPRRDIEFVPAPRGEGKRMLAQGKVDAYLGFPPDPQELRAKKIGRVIVNSTSDRPWSQYYCCVVAGNRDFVSKHPVATRRALRAILKATDICALEPQRATDLAAARIGGNHDYSLQAVNEIPFRTWRTHDVEDTVRFYSLRLNEAGMIKAGPQKIIAQATDWRFVKELRKELKG